MNRISASYLKATLNKSLARRASRLRAVCVVANPRHSYGYGCGLRLASHPAAGRAPSRELIQRCLCSRKRARAVSVPRWQAGLSDDLAL